MDEGYWGALAWRANTLSHADDVANAAARGRNVTLTARIGRVTDA
jgi:hypothetical protein